MLKIALTGPMGSGKSTLADKLRSYGAYIADIDDIIKTHLQTNDTVINVLHSEFGPTFIQEGQINLRLMYELFSRDALSYSRFHKIIHPFIETAAAELYKQAKKSNFKYFVLVAPYVIEDKNSLNRKFDFIVSVECSKENQINRLIKRTNLSKKNLFDLIGLDSLSYQRKLQANLIVQNNSNFKHVEMLASHINNSIQKIGNTKKIFNLKRAILSMLFFGGFSGALSAAPCINTLITNGANLTISSNCDDLNLNGANIVTINAGVTISSSSAGGFAAVNSGASNSLINIGTIIGNSGDGFHNNASLETLLNTGTVRSYGQGGETGLLNSSSIDTLYNSGIVQGLNNGLRNNVGSTINILTNAAGGSISAGGPGISNSGTIETLTNLGTIGSAFTNQVYNGGTITTLNNLQSTSLSSWRSISGLLYTGALPTNYNIIINSASTFGKVESEAITGSTNFGIYQGSLITSRLYTGVLQGFENINVSPTSRTGTYDNMNWTLALQSGSLTTWDLSFTGASLTQTQSSLASHARKLSGTLNIASLISNFSNSNTYDCNLFDVKGMCISAGGRYSTVDNPSSNSSAAVVTLGYKVNSNIRIGGFLDQSVNTHSPTGIDISNKHPMMGAFAYWNQNADGLGYQVKLANAYQDKDLTTTRDVIGTSEAGTGKTSLNSRSYVGELSYAFMYKENTLVRPYFALRHTTIEQDAYTETGVTTPLTYSAINNRTTSALMGVKFKHALTPKANLIGSLGIEQDLHHKTDRLTATGIAGLTSENLSSDLHRTRPVASIGATYDIAKSQRLTGEVLVQQLPFQSSAGATAYFNYMIGF